MLTVYPVSQMQLYNDYVMHACYVCILWVGSLCMYASRIICKHVIILKFAFECFTVSEGKGREQSLIDLKMFINEQLNNIDHNHTCHVNVDVKSDRP